MRAPTTRVKTHKSGIYMKTSIFFCTREIVSAENGCYISFLC